MFIGTGRGGAIVILIAITLIAATSLRGAAISAQFTEHVSVSSGEAPGNGASFVRAMSLDGRFILFSSQADNLVSNDIGPFTDLFLRDRFLGTTELVSRNSNGAQGNSASSAGDISPDGRYVVFSSQASNLVANDSNGASDIFLRDFTEGNTIRVSVSAEGVEAEDRSEAPTLSSDGQLIVFSSDADNLTEDAAANPSQIRRVFLRDLSTGETRLIGNGDRPKISGYGRFVTYHTIQDNFHQAFLYDIGLTQRSRTTPLD